MDPNNNQPLETNPTIQQPVPVAAPPTNVPESTKGKNNKVIISLVILLLLVVGIISYILFAKTQMNNAQKASMENSSVVIPSPSPTLVPTLTPEEDLEVASPEADLIDIEADVKGL